MSDTPTDPVLLHLRQRKAHLQREQLAIDGRIAEVTDLILKLEDGRTAIAKRRRTNSAPAEPIAFGQTALLRETTGTGNSAPPATQPEPYDDSVSLDEAQGVLADARNG